MELHKKFNILLKDYISPVLKDQGWKKKNNNYFISINDNVGIIEFQRNPYNSSDELSFTINLAVSVDYLNKYFNYDYSIKKLPHSSRCHWFERIGTYINNQDFWWKITEDTMLEDIGADIALHLKNILPTTIFKFLDEDELLKIWKKGLNGGLTDYNRLIYLSVLSKRNMDFDLLNKTLEELEILVRGKIQESYIKDFKKQLLS